MFVLWEVKCEGQKSPLLFKLVMDVCRNTAMGCAFAAGVLCCKVKDWGSNSNTQTEKLSTSHLFIAPRYGEIAVAKSTWEQFCLTVEQKMVQNVLKFWKNSGMLCC